MPKNSTFNIYELIYNKVKRIPEGKVTTFGSIALTIGLKNPRIIGFALHTNKDPKSIPCHRVVNKYGKLSSGYAFGGTEKQSQKLRNEGVKVVNNIVDLSLHYWDPMSK